MEEQLRIEGTPEELDAIRKELFKELGEDLDLAEEVRQRPGELSEPILIGLVIALGGPTVVHGVVRVLDRYMKHRERMVALSILRENAEPATLADLKALAS